MVGGMDFEIRKWSLQGELLFIYSHHHSAVRCLRIVKEDVQSNEMEVWSCSNESLVAHRTYLDNVEEHEPLGELKICSG